MIDRCELREVGETNPFAPPDPCREPEVAFPNGYLMMLLVFDILTKSVQNGMVKH